MSHAIPLTFDEAYVVAQIGIHDDDEVTSCVFHSMHVCSSQSEFSRSRSQEYSVLAVNLYQLFCNLLRSIRTVIIDNNDFEIDFAEI